MLWKLGHGGANERMAKLSCGRTVGLQWPKLGVWHRIWGMSESDEPLKEAADLWLRNHGFTFVFLAWEGLKGSFWLLRVRSCNIELGRQETRSWNLARNGDYCCVMAVLIRRQTQKVSPQGEAYQRSTQVRYTVSVMAMMITWVPWRPGFSASFVGQIHISEPTFYICKMRRIILILFVSWGYVVKLTWKYEWESTLSTKKCFEIIVIRHDCCSNFLWFELFLMRHKW